MSVPDLQEQILDALWTTVDRDDSILSATLPGSFAELRTLENVSDIDLVLILDRLDRANYHRLLDVFQEALGPVLAGAGWRLHINPTLGPLKFDEPGTAVLHLMLYSRAAHVEHCIRSPFTCLDWQRSSIFRKNRMQDIYPVFRLQPHHFFGARRSASEYLKDFRASQISYREIIATVDGYEEISRSRPMDQRGRHEFAYHIMKFLMQNFIKLVERNNTALAGEALLNRFSGYLPQGSAEHAQLFRSLTRRKQEKDFINAESGLDDRLTTFVTDFESEFRRLLFDESSQHLFFRHARTPVNRAGVFFGRTEAEIEAVSSDSILPLADSVAALQPARTFVSPRKRCHQSMDRLSREVCLPPALVETQLAEIDYGSCEGLTGHDAQEKYPTLFEAWSRHEDPPFPGGENTAAVLERLRGFVAEKLIDDGGNSVVCSHNVVLRCLIGDLMGVPRHEWHRLKIPHLAPIRVLQSARFGLFLDLDESVEREVFSDFMGGS